ncbi:protein O-glucosyltransferase 2-like [Coccinella septempunctata]|uniref:protein O-glucosyltransferase 2-like n=1 Tax=Coccinella septempunctata TaxID=41139 RepID=UPI001D08364B|nr:protein O-glucosyltransferase 2-like [Coccinella septempunctata]
MIKIFIISFFCLHTFGQTVSPKFTRIWGPGLHPDKIVMPARYFFIEARDNYNKRFNHSIADALKVSVEGLIGNKRPCRININKLDREDGSLIVRYKLFEKCDNLMISITYSGEHIAESPYKYSQIILSEQCDCPNGNLPEMLNQWDCGFIPKQISQDLMHFNDINWDDIRVKVIEKFNKPYSISLCHYVIKSNRIYRKCYGQYVGFKMFMDNILLSLVKKSVIPDIEFFVNLGDWPLVTKADGEVFPIFSWCGSSDNLDIVMPTYDITESTLENMGRVMLDMLSVQGNTKGTWDKREPKAFWRGRDSSRERLKLIEISRNHPNLFNCSLTNFFFFKDKENVYGPKSDHVSFYKFFDYKYQVGLDGTVAAYRFPYLMAGGSLIFKQDSKYYEHFYNSLESYVHYIPVKRNLEDLVSKIEWAISNDEEARTIAENARLFANENLLPKNIYCYYSQLLNEFSKKIKSQIVILEGMEEVEQNTKIACDCPSLYKDEL